MVHCHAFAYGGYASIDKSVSKILQVGLFWPSLFKDVYAFIKMCDQCQHTRNISKRNEMPLKNILEVNIFDFWGMIPDS